MSSLSSYIAQKYLSASTPSSHHHDSDRPKKRRKKEKKDKEGRSRSDGFNTLIIADDDDDDDDKRAAQDGDADADDPQMDTSANSRSAEFRRTKKSGWMDVSATTGGATSTDGHADGGQEEADQILRETMAQDRQRRREVEMEDAPAVVDDVDIGDYDHDDSARPKMASGVCAGLQTAADTAKLVEKEEEEERRRKKKKKEDEKRRKKSGEDKEGEDDQEETIYRDASGRRIDVNAKRIEARQREREAEELKKRQREEAMGDVQRRERQERKQDLEDAKFLTLARTEDDEEMNERLKSQVRWGDVMAGYMAEKQNREGDDRSSRAGAVPAASGKSRDGGEGGQKSRLPTGRVYQGHAPPNRYGIKPGWRWDGVDRGNGFEKQWFQARAQKARNTDLTYQWQEDE